MLAGLREADLPVRLDLPLQRCISGMLLTELIQDVWQGPCTVIAPVDRAFDDLPWSFQALLAEDALVEPRFDLFEYLVIRDVCPADGPLKAFPTLQGEPIRVGQSHVLGCHGVGRILASASWPGVIVHAIDACVLPASVLMYEMNVLHS